MAGVQLLPPPSRDFQLWYSIAVLDTAGYVLFFAVATLALRLLWRSRGSATTTGRRLLLPYTAVMLALGVTIFAIEMYAVSNAVRLSAAGVPFAGLVPGVSIGAEIAINALGQLVALMNDAFLVYRAYSISRRRRWAVVLPCLLWTASLVLAIVQNVLVLTIPVGKPPPPSLNSVSLAWIGTNLALNVTLTATIVATVWPGRRATHRNVVRRASSVIGILTESAAVYTAACLLYVVAVATSSPYGTLVLQLYSIAAFMCSGVITLRIAQGIEYVPSTNVHVSSDIQMVSNLSSRWPEAGAEVSVKIDQSKSFGV